MISKWILNSSSYFNRKLFKVAVIVTLIGGSLFVVHLLNVSIQSYIEELKRFIAFSGYYGNALFFFLYALTVVFSPIAASPFVVVGLLVFGLMKSLVLIYVASLVGAVINFFISKKFGRPVVSKLIGEKRLKRFDGTANTFGIKSLIVLRLIGVGSFDVISYIAGLTPMKFYVYFLITAICSVPRLIVVLYVMDQAFESSK